MKKFTKILCAMLLLILPLCMLACDEVPTGKAAYDFSKTGEGEDIRMMRVKDEIDAFEIDDFEPSDQKSDYVLISIKDYGKIVVLLRRDVAPITVKNFKKLVSNKFYDGTVFHRVVENFMIQGGGYTVFGEELREKPAESIKGEFAQNKVENNLCHYRGVIAMARNSVNMDSASSQFFIVHQTSSHLDGGYASFGYVLAGMDVVDAIAACEVDNPSAQAPKPIKPVVIESITFVQPK